MPIRYIPRVKGFKYGKSGKVYTGKGAREKARKQGQAIEISKLRSSGRLVERKGEIVKVRSSRRARGYKRRL